LASERSVLRLEHIAAHYGGVQALSDVSLEVPAGAIVTLLGANGAGKSTTLRTITGLVRPSRGTVRYEDTRIDGLRSDEIVRRGISLVPERRELFPEMTVEENLVMGGYTKPRRQVSEGLAQAYALFPGLRARRHQPAQTLSGGQQQMVAIGRALMARPRLLLLDEPTLGLAPLLVQRIFGVIGEINRLGTTILLIEQNAFRALPISRYAYVLETGRVVLSGPSQDLVADPRVKQSYLGEI
jgi:branched-chain amino acid transport system ATP-binding protein